MFPGNDVRMRPWLSSWLAVAALWTALCGAGFAAAADAPSAGGGEAGVGVVGGEFPDFFNAAAMRQPLPGEWAEYRVAFPVDRLENSLRGDPAAAPEDADAAKEPDVPAAAWRVLPLRIEIREVTDGGANALLAFGGMTHPIFLPRRPENADAAEFAYDPPAEGDDRRIFVTIGGEEIEVESVLRRTGDGEGFVRWTHPDVPFGMIRFAAPAVDFMLVGRGRGAPPEFPLPMVDAVTPPLGRLWRGK